MMRSAALSQALLFRSWLLWAISFVPASIMIQEYLDLAVKEKKPLKIIGLERAPFTFKTSRVNWMVAKQEQPIRLHYNTDEGG